MENLKAKKRKLKAAMKGQLNELAGCCVVGGETQSRGEMENIQATLERLEGQKEKAIEILETYKLCIRKRKTLKRK